jgi:hypothetical protein
MSNFVITEIELIALLETVSWRGRVIIQKELLNVVLIIAPATKVEQIRWLMSMRVPIAVKVSVIPFTLSQYFLFWGWKLKRL